MTPLPPSLQCVLCSTCLAAGVVLGGEAPDDPVTGRLLSSGWRFGRTFNVADGKTGNKLADVLDVALFNGRVVLRYKHAGGTIIGRIKGRQLQGRYFQQNIEGDIVLVFNAELTRATGWRHVATGDTNGRLEVWLERTGPASYDQPIRSLADIRLDGPSKYDDTLKSRGVSDLVLYGMRKRNVCVLMRYYNTSDSPTEGITHYLTLPESDAHQQVLSLDVAPRPARVHELASGQRVAELHIPPLPAGGCAFAYWTANMILSHARLMPDGDSILPLENLPSPLKEQYLAADRKLALDSREVIEAAAEAARDADGALALIRGAHYKVMDALYYKACGWPSVDQVLRHGHGVCGDYSRVVMALCRKNGIPCRTVYGFAAPGNMDETDFAFGYVDHAWNEAYLPGYGWMQFDTTNNDSKKNRDWTIGYIDANHIIWERRTGEQRPRGRRTTNPGMHAWKWRWDRYWSKAAAIEAEPLSAWADRLARAATWNEIARQLATTDDSTRHALTAALLCAAGSTPTLNEHLTRQETDTNALGRTLRLLAAAAGLGNRVAYWFFLAADNGALPDAHRQFWREAGSAFTETESWRDVEERLALPSVGHCAKIVPLEVLEVEPQRGSGLYRISALREFPEHSVYDERLQSLTHDRALPVSWAFGLAADGRTLFVSERNGGRILRVGLDTDTITPGRLQGVETEALRGLTATPGGMLLAATGTAILQVDPATWKATEVHQADTDILALARAPDALYVTYDRQPRIAVLNPESFVEVRSLDIPVTERRGVRGMTVRGRELWLTDTGNRRILVMDRGSGRVTTRFFSRYEHYVNGLAFVGDRLYATHSFNSESRLCTTYWEELPGPGQPVRSARYRVKIRYRCSLRNRSDEATGRVTLSLPVLLGTPRQRVESVEFVGADAEAVSRTAGERTATFVRETLPPKKEWAAGWDAVATLDSFLYSPTPETAGLLEETPDDVREAYGCDTPVFGLGEESIKEHLQKCCPAEEKNALAVALAIRSYVFDRLYVRTLKPEQWRSGAGVLDQGFGSNEEYARAFVALCRAKGLAARVCGLHAIPNSPGLRGVVLNQTRNDKYVRVWAEVFLPRIGWVPLEMEIEDRGDRGPHGSRFLFGLTWRYVQMAGGYRRGVEGTDEWVLGPSHAVEPAEPRGAVRVRRSETVSFVILDECVE